MQNSEEKQGEIRKPSSASKAKQQEKYRMEKTRDLFKKIRDTKGTFHGKMGSMKKIKLGHSFFPLFNLSANYILLNSKFKV